MSYKAIHWILAGLSLGAAVFGGTEPAVVDETAKLTPADGSAGQMFGTGVAVHGSMALVGAWAFDDEGTHPGSAYVFEQHPDDPATWTEITKLIPNPGVGGGMFGLRVALSESFALVSAPGEDDPGTDAGAAYLYGRNQEGAEAWGLIRRLTADDAAVGAFFGGSVAVHETLAVVSAPGAEHSGTACGAAYVFERDHGGSDQWQQVAKLVADDCTEGDSFGAAVVLNGTSVLVGAPGQDAFGTDAGAAYLFDREQGGRGAWGQVKKISASDANPGQGFGWAVSFDGTTALVGASFDDHSGEDSGSAYIFERDQGGPGAWGQVKKLIADSPAPGELFGSAVSLDGSIAVVGANAADNDLGLTTGSAYVFDENFGGPGAWGLAARLQSDELGDLDFFGISVAISESTAMVGAHWDGDNGPLAGAAYVFEVSPSANLFADGFESGDLSAWTASP